MKKRNPVVDIIKLIAAYCIICLHFSFPGWFGKIIYATARFAVPFFFMVSGYYYYKSDKTVQYKSTGAKIRHIALLFFTAEFLNMAWAVVSQYNFQVSPINNIITAFSQRIDNYQYWRALHFAPVFNYSAWFLAELIVVYAIFALITKFSLLRVAKYVAIVSYVLGFLALRICYLADISLFPFFDYVVLFMGFPFFSLGYYLKESNFVPKKMKNPYLCGGLLILGAVMSCIEKPMFPVATVYLGSLLIIFVLFSIFVNYGDDFKETKISKLLSYMGNKLGLYIYILHPFLGGLIERIVDVITKEAWIDYLTPVFICIVSTVVSFVVFPVNDAIAKKLREIKSKKAAA